ncbi:MAG: hypothetical protein ACI3W5_00425 [Faecousia sp.]
MAQPKVLKMAEYFVYFPFSKLNGCDKRFTSSRRRFIQSFLYLMSAEQAEQRLVHASQGAQFHKNGSL